RGGPATNPFGTTTAVTVAATGTMELGGFAATIGSLSGAGILQNNSATAANLTVGLDNTDTTFSGIIQDGGTGKLAILKQGTGILYLSGTNSTFSGLFTNGNVNRPGFGARVSVTVGGIMIDSNGSLGEPGGGVYLSVNNTTGGGLIFNKDNIVLDAGRVIDVDNFSVIDTKGFTATI